MLFGLAHYADQGMAGVVQAVITGFVFGAVYMVRKEIVSPMITHAVFDVTAVLLIYWNLEASVAHEIFR
jgi:membrane protease YdiL (CAAX protease family)